MMQTSLLYSCILKGTLDIPSVCVPLDSWCQLQGIIRDLCWTIFFLSCGCVPASWFDINFSGWNLHSSSDLTQEISSNACQIFPRLPPCQEPLWRDVRRGVSKTKRMKRPNFNRDLSGDCVISCWIGGIQYSKIGKSQVLKVSWFLLFCMKSRWTLLEMRNIRRKLWNIWRRWRESRIHVYRMMVAKSVFGFFVWFVPFFFLWPPPPKKKGTMCMSVSVFFWWLTCCKRLSARAQVPK